MKTYMINLDNAFQKEKVIKYSDHKEEIKEMEDKIKRYQALSYQYIKAFEKMAFEEDHGEKILKEYIKEIDNYTYEDYTKLYNKMMKTEPIVYIYKCELCGKPVKDYVPEFCCGGQECGCMGFPTEPCFCSQECLDAIMNGIGKDMETRRIDAGIEKWKEKE